MSYNAADTPAENTEITDLHRRIESQDLVIAGLFRSIKAILDALTQTDISVSDKLRQQKADFDEYMQLALGEEE